ncbi:MAG TPA: NTP transferase domain-containing protein [Acidimicrobiales bacterium]|nr:NTP transferase domain-containing protein [Acidimicrobiales bacterium]
MTPSGSNHDRPVLVILAAGLAKRYGGTKPLAPVGLHGEAVIDLTAADAVSGGFGDIVVVLGPQTGPAIAYHVRRAFPPQLRVTFAEQRVPLGTAHAVLCARKHVGDGPFAVVNSDDVYGSPALALLAGHLASPAGPDGEQHAIVAYHLADTVVTDDPVTRGACEVDAGGLLVRLVERRKVARQPDGRFVADDGLDPGELSPDTPTSMNLWGFRPSIWPVLEAAVVGAHPSVAPDGSVRDPEDLNSDAEVLLPEVVGAAIAGTRAGGPDQVVRVLTASGRCIGVTHAEDLPVVRTELAQMIGRGLRPENPWEGVA